MASFENPIAIIEKYCVEETSENNCCKKVWKKKKKIRRSAQLKAMQTFALKTLT